MFKTKQAILNILPELNITEYGDFVLKDELIGEYEIIDFHTHIFDSVSGNIPWFLRREKENMGASFFDLSCYPESPQYFDFNKVGYRKWPKSFRSISGLKTLWYLTYKGISLIKKVTVKRMLRDLEKQNIDSAVILPINTKKYDCTQEMLKSIDSYSNLIPFASIHPEEDNIENKVKNYLEKDIKGFKINPHLMGTAISDSSMINLVKILNETKLPIISCSGIQIPNYITGVPKFMEDLLGHNQELSMFDKILPYVNKSPFVFAHAGLEQIDKLILLMKKYTNTYADISTQPSINIRKLIDEIGYKRLLFGSDYPYINQSFTILAILKATKNEHERKAIFSGNAKRLLSEIYC